MSIKPSRVPSAQAASSTLQVAPHPSLATVLPSSHDNAAGAHTPPAQTSGPVQALPALQSSGVPPVHPPFWHLSATVQDELSLHRPLLTGWAQPSVVHRSSVQGSSSLPLMARPAHGQSVGAATRIPLMLLPRRRPSMVKYDPNCPKLCRPVASCKTRCRGDLKVRK